jgi:hypothetical protein
MGNRAITVAVSEIHMPMDAFAIASGDRYA